MTLQANKKHLSHIPKGRKSEMFDEGDNFE